MKPEIIININIEVYNIPTVNIEMLEKAIFKNLQDSISAIDYSMAPLDKILDDISFVVLHFYPDIHLDELKKPGRESKYVIPRQIIIVLACKFHEIKAYRIAHYFGNRNRTCVQYAKKVIKDVSKVDKTFRKHFQTIETVYSDLLNQKKNEAVANSTAN